ncbi:MAG TPA: hypothetical protein VGK87_14105 [Anaerolineae bacterium]|jgi:hypothetical protein
MDGFNMSAPASNRTSSGLMPLKTATVLVSVVVGVLTGVGDGCRVAVGAIVLNGTEVLAAASTLGALVVVAAGSSGARSLHEPNINVATNNRLTQRDG